VFYVTTSGSDSSPGTQAQPWRTIQRAASTLTAGQKALVAPGNYSEDVSVTRDLVGPQPATIEALDPANMPVVLGSLRPQNAAAYWRFSNLKLDGTASGHEYGIKVTGNGTATVPHHLEFYGMEVYNVDSGLPQPQGISVQGGTGSTVPHDLHFYNNLVHHIGGPSASQNQTHSFYFGQCEDMVVANNVSRDSRGWGFRMGSAESNVKGMRNSILVNNTVVRSSAGGGFTLYEEGSGAPPHYLSAGNRFYNNIVSDVQGLRAYSSWFLSQVSGPADVLNLWDKNLAYLVGALSYNGDGAHVSSTFVSQPINADPKFVNKAGNDFHLQAGSPAIGAGLPDYTPPFDFDGNPRTTADLGAFRG